MKKITNKSYKHLLPALLLAPALAFGQKNDTVRCGARVMPDRITAGRGTNLGQALSCKVAGLTVQRDTARFRLPAGCAEPAVAAQVRISATRYLMNALVIDINTTPGAATLVICRRDSTSRALGKDERYRALMDTIQELNGPAFKDTARIARIIRDLETVQDAYSYFRRDTLRLSETGHAELLALVRFYSRAQDPDPVKPRIVLDGVSFKATIERKGKWYERYAQSPSREIHPVLRALLEKSIATYRAAGNRLRLSSTDTYGL